MFDCKGCLFCRQPLQLFRADKCAEIIIFSIIDKDDSKICEISLVFTNFTANLKYYGI